MAKKTTTTTKKTTAAKKPPTKSEIYAQIAESTGLTRKQVASVFDELGVIMKKNLGSRGPQEFTVPGMFKVTVKKKPATKGGMRPNPFQPGEMMEVKPKPASKQVKVRPLKSVKDMV